MTLVQPIKIKHQNGPKHKKFPTPQTATVNKGKFLYLDGSKHKFSTPRSGDWTSLVIYPYFLTRLGSTRGTGFQTHPPVGHERRGRTTDLRITRQTRYWKVHIYGVRCFCLCLKKSTARHFPFWKQQTTTYNKQRRLDRFKLFTSTKH